MRFMKAAALRQGVFLDRHDLGDDKHSVLDLGAQADRDQVGFAFLRARAAPEEQIPDKVRSTGARHRPPPAERKPER
jgi:hypothetical protein